MALCDVVGSTGEPEERGSKRRVQPGLMTGPAEEEKSEFVPRGVLTLSSSGYLQILWIGATR